MRTLHDFWVTCEIAAVALVDNAIWHWMYENPAATPSEIKAATLAIAREIWNTYFAPIFKVNDATILAVYSHMISYPLYLTDYPLGHLITYQIEEVVRQEGLVGPVFDRMVRIGNINPDLWMKQATGSEVGPQALLQLTEAALKYIEKK
jgi:oligoendopeptidase F